MARAKGSPKLGGRAKGAPNKLTLELRERIKLFLEDNFPLVERDFKALEPEKRIALFEKYLKFALPQLQSAEIGLSLEKMSENQLDQIINRILTSNSNDKDSETTQ
mgnify:CR=1 FL=1